MSGQRSYNYFTPKGTAGSLYDLSPHSIDSRVNGESDEKTMMFGMGGVRGDSPGTNVILPVAASSSKHFEGIIMTGYTNEMNMQGEINISPLQIIGVLRWGKCWARIDPDVTPAYGDDLYLIKDGDKAGLFTNVSGGSTMAVKGRFIGSPGTGAIAPVEIYNQKAE